MDSDLSSLTISGLRHRCSQESDRFFKRQDHDPRYCYELFRRAVLQHDQHAWELIFYQYQPLVASWVERHPLFPAINEETEFFSNWAFEKMWSVLTPEKFSRFSDLKSLLRYLQMCVHSVMVDYMRAKDQAVLLEDEGVEPTSLEDPSSPSLEEQVLERTQGQELWRMLEERFKNEKERLVIYGSFVLALKPSEIFDLYPGAFKEVREIYLVKENVLARLRRDPELIKFVEV